MLRNTLAAATFAALASGALASDDFPVPSGFNLESNALGLPIHGVLDDGRLMLVTHGNDGLRLLQPDHSTVLFATGFGSLAGFAQLPDGTIVVGDSFAFGGTYGADLVQLRDLNGDDDALDPGEAVPFPVALPAMSDGLPILPFNLAVRPGTDELYVSGSTFTPVGGVVRIAGGVAAPWAELGTGFTSGVVFADADTLLVADPGLIGPGQARLVALTDTNSDGDALDAGESVDLVAGLTGASDVAVAADGTIFLSGTTATDGSRSITRVTPGGGDGGGVVADVDWATGFGFSSGLALLEGPAGFDPGADGDGRLYVTDFFDPFPAPPTVRSIRSAPLAAVWVDGTIAANSAFDLVADAALGADAVFVLSLDQTSHTIPGLGDIGLGFGAPFLISPMVPVDGSGEARLPVVFHGLDAAAGLEFSLQAFSFQNGDIGIGNVLDLVIQS